MTPKYSQILWWPQKTFAKSSYPKNYFFLKTPKNIEIQNFEPKKKDLSLRMYENIRVPPLGVNLSQEKWNINHHNSPLSKLYQAPKQLLKTHLDNWQ